MHLLGRDQLESIKGHNAEIDKWLNSWLSEFTHARWWCADDVLRQFPMTQELGDDSFLFQTGLGEHCIEVLIAFPQGVAIITTTTKIKKEDSNGR